MNGNNKQEVLKAVKENGLELENVSDRLKGDKEIVLEAVKQNGRALQYAPNELKADKKIVTATVKQDGGALEYASDELKADKKIVTIAVKQDGMALEYASVELKADKEVVLVAVKNWGMALEFASDDLKADKEVVLVAVKNWGMALEFASDELKANKEVVLVAVKNWGMALEYASDELKADQEVVLVSNSTTFDHHFKKWHIDNFSECYFSDSLRFLLSSQGGLGIQFIKLFLEKLSCPSKNLSHTQVLREYPLQSNSSVKKLDLLFLNLGSNLIVGIENKFLSEDSAEQLDTYYELLNEQFGSSILVYLTLDGRKPKNSHNDKIVSLSWLNDIYPMIEKAKPNAKNDRIENLLKHLDDISTLKKLSDVSKNLSHPFEMEEFAKQLYKCLGAEWKFSPVKLEFIRNNAQAKGTSIHKFTISFNQSQTACVLKSKHIQVYLPFALNGKQINYLITNFLVKMNTTAVEPIKLDGFFNIPYKEYQMYRYFQAVNNPV